RASAGEDLEVLMEQEKIIRTRAEVDRMISLAGSKGDALIENVLGSKQDYIVDFRRIDHPPPAPGSKVDDLPVDDAIIDTLRKKGIENLYAFQEEALKGILRGKDVVITAPTASGKTEAFTIPILQKISEEVSHFGSLRPSEGGKI